MSSNNQKPAYWCKVNFSNSRRISKYYDFRFDIEDGFYKRTKSNGTIIESNYVNGKIHGQYMIKYVDGRIEKGNMYNGKRHGTWEYYFREDNQMPAYWCKCDF